MKSCFFPLWALALLLLPACHTASRSGASAPVLGLERPGETGVAIEGTSTMRLVGFVVINGHPRVVAWDSRLGVVRLTQGERENTLVSRTLSGPMEPGKDFIECERLDLAGGTCVLRNAAGSFNLTVPSIMREKPRAESLWLTNCLASVGLEILGELTVRTVLARDDLNARRLKSVVCHPATAGNAAARLIQAFHEQGIEVRPHGNKWMLALPREDQARFLKALPPVPVSPPQVERDPLPEVSGSAFTKDHRVRAGFIKLLNVPLSIVADLYGESCLDGRKLSRSGGLPARQTSIRVMLMTEATLDEIKHMFDVLFLLNDLKVVLVGDDEFKIVER